MESNTKENKFDINCADSQSTVVEPMRIDQFDLDAYHDYEAALLERNKKFCQEKSGIQIYRRFRADKVFYDGCKDMKLSLELQLSALNQSMKYKADIANFLEPWYGIGYIASAFGGDYTWTPGQAPAVHPKFKTVSEVINADYQPIVNTAIGKHTLNMIEYFLDQTKGKIPISYSDVQSPLNMMSYLLNITDLFMEMYDDPNGFKEATALVTKLAIDFLKEQKELIGDCLASPGHGFASSRVFSGVGLSTDNILMVSSEDYKEFVKPYDEKMGEALGGLVFHSCGNWTEKIDLVKSFKNILTADGAFSPQTDPSFNDPGIFGERLKGSGIVLNARIVGDEQTIIDAADHFIYKDMKSIIVTYCKSPQEQEYVYDCLHEMAKARHC
ncbi:MAG: hypothetical protein K0S71_2430 [Clostridia bacterium]|jgi:hypothetical protein|nr:hypothetical protein [Clostridia bacterium]